MFEHPLKHKVDGEWWMVDGFDMRCSATLLIETTHHQL